MHLIQFTGALIEQDGKILIAQRNGEGIQALNGNFPGARLTRGKPRSNT